MTAKGLPAMGKAFFGLKMTSSSYNANGGDCLENGLLFYWFGWMLWIIVTFLMKKTELRTKIACWILIAILSSNVNINIDNYHVSLTFLILFGSVIILHAQLPRMMYHTFISFIITIGYAAILLWEQNTPVWLFLPRFILIPAISVMIISILVKGVYNRLVIGLLGLSAGELLYNMLLTGYDLQTSIGKMAYLDNLTITIVIIILLGSLHKGKVKLSSLLTHYNQSWMMKFIHRRYRSSS